MDLLRSKVFNNMKSSKSKPKIKIFRSYWLDKQFYIFYLLLIIFLNMIFSSSPVFSADKHKQYQSRANALRNSPTFHIQEKFSYPADTELVRFLLSDLNFSGAAMDIWNLGNFTVRKKTDQFFKAQKGNDLEGKCYRLVSTDSTVIYVGDGIFRPENTPIDVDGSALISVRWKTTDQRPLSMSASLRLSPKSWLLHWVGKVIYVIVKPELRESFHELIDRGKKLARYLRNQPEKTQNKLKINYPDLSIKWKKFISRNNY